MSGYVGIRLHPLYGVWSGIKRRCLSENDRSYKNYGGRGISISIEWMKYENFYFDNFGRYRIGCEIDRIDNNGNYSLENTRFVTSSVNCRNKSNNRSIELNGESLCVSDWADRYNIKPSIIFDRLDAGWSEYDAITKPKADMLENMLIAQAKRWEGHTKIIRKPKTDRKLKIVTYNHKEYTVKQLSDLCGVGPKLLAKRIFERNWTVERAVINENFKGTNQFNKAEI